MLFRSTGLHAQVVSFGDNPGLVGIVTHTGLVDGVLTNMVCVPTKGIQHAPADKCFKWHGPIPEDGIAKPQSHVAKREGD